MRLLFAALIAFAAAPGAAEPTEAAITAAARHYGALLAGSGPADIAAAYAEDGELVLPGQAPIHGRAALTAMLTAAMQGAKVMAVEMTVENASVTGATASASGHYRETAAVGTAQAADYTGRFDSQWIKTRQQWLIARMTMKPE